MRISALTIVCVSLVLSGCLFANVTEPKVGDTDLPDVDLPDTDAGDVDCLLHSTYDGQCNEACRDVDPDCPACELSCGDGWEEIRACRAGALCKTVACNGEELECERLPCEAACEENYIDSGDTCPSGPDVDCYLDEVCGWPVACEFSPCTPECAAHYVLVEECGRNADCDTLEQCGQTVTCEFRCAQKIECSTGYVEHHSETDDTFIEEVCGVQLHCVNPDLCDSSALCPDGYIACSNSNPDCEEFVTCGSPQRCRPG